MKQPPLLRTARVMLVLVAITAWLHAANHCVVAGLLPSPTAAGEHSECPGHPAPAGDEEERNCDGTGCCKALSAPLALAKNLVGYSLADFLTTKYAAIEFSRAIARRPVVVLELDTGPPGPPSFAESVLQRSILAHAPPFSA